MSERLFFFNFLLILNFTSCIPIPPVTLPPSAPLTILPEQSKIKSIANKQATTTQTHTNKNKDKRKTSQCDGWSVAGSTLLLSNTQDLLTCTSAKKVSLIVLPRECQFSCSPDLRAGSPNCHRRQEVGKGEASYFLPPLPYSL